MTPSMIVAIGVDVGTSNTKVVALDVQTLGARILATASGPTPDDGGDLIQLVARLMRRVTSTTQAPTVIGIASMAETGLILGRDGRALSAVIRWNSFSEIDRPSAIVAELGQEEFGRLTGLPVLRKVPLLVWERLADTDSRLWKAGARWAGVADLIAFALTRELVTDHTLAARTGAVTRFGEFDRDLLERVGMTPDNLARVAAPGEPAGAVTPSAADNFGLPSGVPVFIAGHDHAVGAWAAGVREPGQVADSLGTSEAIIRILGEPTDRIAVTRAGMSLGRTVDGYRECVVAGAAGAGALIGALRNELDLSDARDLDDGPTAELVLPYPSGRQTPSPDPTARLSGFDRSRGPQTRTRALFEGLALHARWMYEEQRAIAGDRDVGPIHVLGGAGGANELWLATKGAVFPIASARVLSSEPVAVGAASLAATRAGMNAAGPIPTSPLPAPDPRYQRVFESFVATARRER
ncbi:MAG TPA: FGGY family carbohydrate kinase [Galbitalea sp.]|jgi:sugar (pentulose or hexulose) kinase|nr:FGGY family carbohydrate kinase [Galbitalea sp.]